MRILVTGFRGMIGSALVPALRAQGHRVTTLGRGPDADFQWDPGRNYLDPRAVDGVEAVIHLAGESLAPRWTAAQKKKIVASRVEGTRLLAETVAASPRPPRVFLMASAVGFYGDRGEETLTEDQGRGEGFLADLCADWEAAAQPAVHRGVHVVPLRMSIILSKNHGVLSEMIPTFRWGLGGVIGSGRQYVGWVSLRDVVRAFLHALSDERLEGPINVTSPSPARMAAWAVALGRALGRPVWVRTPLAVLRALFGEVVDGLLLTSQRVVPKKLEDAGFVFLDRHIAPALAEALAEPLPARDVTPAPEAVEAQ